MFNKKEYDKNFYQEHKEYIREYQKQYCKDNPEKVKMWSKKYRESHINETREYRRRYDRINAVKEKERKKQWKKDNPEYDKKWQMDNHKKIIEYKRQYYIDNKDKILERERKYLAIRRAKDTRYNINKRISKSIRISLKGNKNGYHWEDLVGYKLSDLIKRLNETMPKEYTWNDYLEGKLQIDHIVPKSAFNYTKSEHIDFKNCWDINNLRLLPAKENRNKYNKLDKPFQPALAI